jgi:hypothetical protein
LERTTLGSEQDFGSSFVRAGFYARSGARDKEILRGEAFEQDE